MWTMITLMQKKLEEAARLEKERIAMDQAYATGGTLIEVKKSPQNP